LEELRPYVQVTNDEPNFRNFLEKFTVLRLFYRSPEIISRLTYEVIEDAVRDRIRYLELRFTPAALAKTQGYALHEVVDWVLLAVEKARQDFPDIQVELIASINRHESLEIAERVTQLAVEHKDDIVGLDLAGDEVNFPAEPFAALFREAHRAGLGLTAHAGEWTGPATVRHAIEALGVQRIGHGVRVMEDPSVADLARQRGVAFEVCVTSNLQSGVIQRLGDHPLPGMAAHSLRATINTDDPAVSDITLTDEYEVAVENLGLSLDALKTTILTAAGCTFLAPEGQGKLVSQFKAELRMTPA
ncbi:MAG: adenosine deaminase, partial [Anaerolineales bacterium]